MSVISEQMTDDDDGDDDMSWRCRSTFSTCADGVKMSLFSASCTQLYILEVKLQRNKLTKTQ